MLRLFFAAMFAVVAMPAHAAYLLIEADGPAGGYYITPDNKQVAWEGWASASATLPIGSPWGDTCWAGLVCSYGGNKFKIENQAVKYWPSLELTFDHPITGFPLSADGFVSGFIRGVPWVDGYSNNPPAYGYGTVTNLKISVMEGEASQNFGVSIRGSVPEPASWAMMIVGFGLLGCALRRPRPYCLRSTQRGTVPAITVGGDQC